MQSSVSGRGTGGRGLITSPFGLLSLGPFLEPTLFSPALVTEKKRILSCVTSPPPFVPDKAPGRTLNFFAFLKAPQILQHIAQIFF